MFRINFSFKRGSIFYSFLFFAPFFVAAQTAITGKVVDEEKAPIPFAGIHLQYQKDSTLIEQVHCDLEGNFSLFQHDSINRPLEIKVSAVGFESVVIKDILREGNIGIIQLKASNEQLGLVEVKAKRIKKTPNGYVIHLKKHILTEGISVAKSLILLPGISKDLGVYKLNGIPISQFYIDGRKVSSEELEAIPADLLQKAEISFIDNIGINRKGGVVNLTLNKPHNGGYYGSLGGTISARGPFNYERLKGNAIINSKINRLHLFGNIRLGNLLDPTQEFERTNFSNGTFIHSERKSNGYSNWVIPNLSVTYDLTNQQTIGLNLSGELDFNKVRQTVENSFYNPENNFIEQQDGHNNIRTLQSTLMYKLKIGDNDKWNFRIQGDFLHRDKDLKNQYWNNKNTNRWGNGVDINSNLWQVYLQSLYSISDYWSTDFALVWDGIQDIYTPVKNTPSDKSFFGTASTSTYVTIHNPYALLSLFGYWGNFSLSARLSYQGSFLKYQIPEEDINIQRHTQGLEPNVRFSYSFAENQKHSIALEYQRSIGTIPYSLLNPSRIWTDRFHYSIGNPDIKPAIEHTTNLIGSFWNDNLYAWIGYTSIVDPITFSMYKDPDLPNVFYYQAINSTSETWWRLGLESNIKVNPKWHVKFRGYSSIGKERILVSSNLIETNSIRKSFHLSNIFSLDKGYSIFTTLYYEPSYKTYNEEYATVYGIDGSITKAFNQKAELTLSCGLGKHRTMFTYLDNATQRYQNKTPLPYFSLSFRLFFHKGERVEVKQTNSSQRYEEMKKNR